VGISRKGVFCLEQIVIQMASIDDAEVIHSMQVEAFKPLLDKYKDFEVSPANENLERTIARLNEQQTDYYLIIFVSMPVGAVRLVKKDNHRIRVSPIFILQAYQGRGIAKAAMRIVEEMYTDSIVWELDTIFEERKLCGLYESLGYLATGKMTKINDNMTIVSYEKQTILE
jgi:GNAT superfamily N-acetyltransferase